MATERRRLFPLEFVAQDLRYAARTCRRNLSFTVVAVFTLALAVGANTAIFSLVNAVLLRPLPYPDPSRMVWFLTTAPEGSYGSASEAKFNAWRAIPSTFEHVSAFGFPDGIVGAGDRQVLLLTGEVTADFFALFGGKFQAGRTFSSAEERPAGGRVAVISDRFWTRWFGRGDAIGRTLQLNHTSYVVIGILQPGLDTQTITSAEFGEVDVWVPLQIDPASTNLDASLVVAGRLLPSMSLAEAQARVGAAALELRRRFPGYARAGDGATVQPLQTVLARHDRTPLLVLSGAVCLVLLIACANLANLLLARGVARTRELAMRVALGATRRRIVQQLATESVLLATMGSVVGFVVGRLAINAVIVLTGPTITRIGLTVHGVPMDGRVLAFTCAVAIVAVLAFGLVPALMSSRVDVRGRLADAGHGGTSEQGHRRTGGWLTMIETGTAVILLVGAALLIRTFANLGRVQPGFDTHNLVAFQLPYDAQIYRVSEAVQMTREAEARLGDIPGVASAAASLVVPFSGSNATLRYVIEGRPLDGLYHGMDGWRPVSPGYFETLRIPLLRGRTFTEQDSANGPPVIVINQAMADKWWPHGGALGQRISLGKGIGGVWEDVSPREIVGIVANVRDVAPDQAPQPTNYVPIAQVRAPLQLAWLVRTKPDPVALELALESTLRTASRGLPVTMLGQVDSLIARSTSHAALRMWLMGAFALIALFLAAIGVYGVLTYTVRQRTREIGIRMAIGAKPRDVTRMVVMSSLGYSLAGVAGGLVAAVVATRLLTTFLFGISPWDPIAFFAAVAVLTVVAGVAAWIPARRAALVDPLIALRGN
jgi:predicted permease